MLLLNLNRHFSCRQIALHFAATLQPEFTFHLHQNREVSDLFREPSTIHSLTLQIWPKQMLIRAPSKRTNSSFLSPANPNPISINYSPTSSRCALFC